MNERSFVNASIRFQNAVHPSFCSKARMIWRQNITGCSGFEISFNGMKLALRRVHELLAQTHELAQR
jgi:hypothetical protein